MPAWNSAVPLFSFSFFLILRHWVFCFVFSHLCSSWLASTELEGESQHLDCHLSHSGTQEIKTPIASGERSVGQGTLHFQSHYIAVLH